MPCPLCHGADSHFSRDSCDVCYPKFIAEREAAKKRSGIIPESIINGERLRNEGFNAWRTGKCAQRNALESGNSEDEAEAIGYKKMEEEAAEEYRIIGRRYKIDEQKRAAQSRLFRHI